MMSIKYLMLSKLTAQWLSTTCALDCDPNLNTALPVILHSVKSSNTLGASSTGKTWYCGTSSCEDKDKGRHKYEATQDNACKYNSIQTSRIMNLKCLNYSFRQFVYLLLIIFKSLGFVEIFKFDVSAKYAHFINILQ